MNLVSVHPPKMELDCALDFSECDIDSLAGGHATREVRNRRSPIAVGILVDAHEVTDRFHGLVPFRCACRFTDAGVPFGMSSPRSPLTVTRPGLDECLIRSPGCTRQRPQRCWLSDSTDHAQKLRPNIATSRPLTTRLPRFGPANLRLSPHGRRRLPRIAPCTRMTCRCAAQERYSSRTRPRTCSWDPVHRHLEGRRVRRSIGTLDTFRISRHTPCVCDSDPSAQRSGSGAVGERLTHPPSTSQPAHRRLQPVVGRLENLSCNPTYCAISVR
jgi:hypothetical protein